jgi:predicted Fe-Mo cluster-binding NifX family protein
MKIALCIADDKKMILDSRFGRCSWFLIKDSETGKNIELIENKGKDAPSGAGNSAVQLVINAKADVVIAPELGPKATQAAKSFGIQVFNQGSFLTADEAYAAWKEGKLQKALME